MFDALDCETQRRSAQAVTRASSYDKSVTVSCESDSRTSIPSATVKQKQNFEIEQARRSCLSPASNDMSLRYSSGAKNEKFLAGARANDCSKSVLRK